MNIVYSSSDSYAELCGISLVSLLENNKDVDSITIYIIDNNISSLNKDRLKETASKYNRELIFVKKVDLEELTHTSINVGRWNIGTFFRLYLSSILPQSVERVIYLDCDIIVRHSLKEVYNLDMGSCLVAGADDCRSDLYRIEIGCEPGSVYINNGFMLIDLKGWRENKLEELFTKFIIERNGDCTYMDQAPLNGVLGPRKQIYELEPKYNSQRVFFDFSYEDLLALRRPEHHMTRDAFDEAVNDPVIVHFTPVFISGTRPWQIEDHHKFTPEYRHYKEMSMWKDEPYRKDDRKSSKKLMTMVCRSTPKFIMIPTMAYLHSTWYPRQRIRLAKKNSLKK